MNCEKIQERFADYLTGDIDAEARQSVQDHIAACPPCREELQNLTAVWAKLGVLPEEQPSGELRTRFYAMLEEAKEEMARSEAVVRKPGFLAGWRDWFTFRRPSFAAAFSVFLLMLGIGAGWFLGGGRVAPGRLEALQREVQEMRQATAVTLLRQPSASDRLQGISYTAAVNRPDAGTLQALIDTLDNDPSPNVRLAAVEALYLFRSQPGVKESLVRSLSGQESPLVQVALIDLLVEIRDQRAAAALKALVERNELNPEVKKFAEDGLKKFL